MYPPKYKQVKAIGTGSFANAFKYELEGVPICVKQLKKEYYNNPDYVKRFKREIQILKELKGHKNIIEIIEDGEKTDKKQLWYSMTLGSDNLYNFIKKKNDLDLKERLCIFEQIVNAIKYGHSKSILHRDLSPNNILIIGNDIENVKVCDFGLGKNSKSLSKYTHSEIQGYGQRYYVAPEQLISLKHTNSHSDTYALGKVLYFIITGKDPINIKGTDFKTLIDKATDDEKNNRHCDIENFEIEYLGIKNLIFNSKITSGYKNLKDISLQTEIDWSEFHFVFNKQDTNLTQDNYVTPIIKILINKSNLNDYYKAVNLTIEEFINKFTENLFNVRIDFELLDNIGDIFINVYHFSKNNQIKLLILCKLWSLFCYFNRYYLKNLIKEVFDDNLLQNDIEIPFASFILNYGVSIPIEEFDIIPTAIKTVLLKLQSETNTNTDEIIDDIF